MVPVRQGNPNMTYNPVAIEGLQIVGEPELITMRAVERIVKVEKDYKLIRCFVTLEDGNKVKYTMEIPYFVYCGLGQVDIVVCKKYTLSSHDRKYYCLEIDSLDKPEVTTADVVEKPLAADNRVLQSDYLNRNIVSGPIHRILNNYMGNIVTGYIHTPRINNYILKAPVSVVDLISGNPIKTEYRHLTVAGEKYMVDLGGVQW